jgi:UMF1 family MFS transporter
MDRISARGFSFGYIGSVLMQMIGFALVITMTADKSLPLKLTFLLVGIWWVSFAQITFRALPISSKKEREGKTHVLANGFKELKLVWDQVKHMPVLKRYLTAFFFYSMGVQTVMLVAIDFGIKELKLENQKLIITAVIIQLVAILGAIGMSKLSAKFGNIKVLLFTVLLWIGVCIAGYFVQTETHFYILASLVGLVMGGTQSLSRSTYSKLMPETKDTASFFSFYDVTEKLAIVIGLFTFGFIEGISTIRQSILSLVVFFALGFIALLLTSVKQKTTK